MSALSHEFVMSRQDVLRLNFVESLIDVFSATITEYGGICSSSKSLEAFLGQAADEGIRGISPGRHQQMAMALHIAQSDLINTYGLNTQGLWDVVTGSRSATLPWLKHAEAQSDGSSVRMDPRQMCCWLTHIYQKVCGSALGEVNRALRESLGQASHAGVVSLTSGLLARCLFETFEPLVLEQDLDPGCSVYFGHLHALRMARALPLIHRLVSHPCTQSVCGFDHLRTDSGFMITLPQQFSAR